MKRSLFILLGALLIIGCAQKQETKLTNWQHFQDPYTKIAFSHPGDWFIQQEGSKISFYSSPEAVVKFNPYAIEGKDAARIVVLIQTDTLETLEKNVRMLIDDLNASGFEVSPSEVKNIADVPGTLVHYRGALDAKNIIEGDHVMALRDSMLFAIKYEAFNKMYGAHKVVLDSVLKSIHLPAPKVADKEVDPSIPAAETEVFDNKFFKLNYPANFSPASPPTKEPIEFSLDLMGYRKDSYIHVDVQPAKGLTAEKVVEQNTKFFKETSRGETTIDGVKTTYLNYSPMKDIQGRVYFLIKNDKIYRIIFTYYASMKSAFLPVFEKTITSFVAK